MGREEKKKNLTRQCGLIRQLLALAYGEGLLLSLAGFRFFMTFFGVCFFVNIIIPCLFPGGSCVRLLLFYICIDALAGDV
jgi:hypothetical protein